MLKKCDIIESINNMSKKSNNIDTTNPFNKGVSYGDFLKNVNDKNTVDSLLKKHDLSKEDVSWVKEELNNFKTNK